MYIMSHCVASDQKSDDICGEAEIKPESTDFLEDKTPKRKKHDIELQAFGR